MGESVEERRERLRRQYFGRATPWPEDLNGVVEQSPEMLESFLRMSAVPWRRPGVVPARIKQLAYIAIDSLPGLQYAPGVVVHSEGARTAGATGDEIRAAIAIASSTLMESVIAGFQSIVEVDGPSVLDAAASTRLREQFAQLRGDWDPRLDALVDSAPDTFKAYLGFLQEVFGSGSPLAALEGELLLLSCLAASWTAGQDTLVFPIARALALGATRAEVSEMIELPAALGLHIPAWAFAYTGADQVLG